ncbi:MAG: DUF433 domain-containing protein [Treponema sp.]|nr:DUF433 domain-containing protein [Treponema sp.]
MEPAEFLRYIAIDRDIRSGKPCIKGTRISIGDILRWLSSGMTAGEITQDFPELEEAHVMAALAFAAARDTITEIVVCRAVGSL